MEQFKHRILPQWIVDLVMVIGVLSASFDAGIVFDRAKHEGWLEFSKVQGINVLFGVLGGLATSVVLWYLTKTGKQVIASWNRNNQYLTGIWEERYELDAGEPVQEQRLILTLKHDGEEITGVLVAGDTHQCPEEKCYGPRSFTVTGLSDGTYVSLDAVLQSSTVGHTVYLLRRRNVSDILDGWTIFHDLNEGKLEAIRTQLVRREHNDIVKDLRERKSVEPMIP